MKRLSIMGLSALLLVALAGCYHATIDTGLAPSSTTIYKPWSNSFIFGLVPPPTVAAAAECPNGVARVETQISFLNGLVSALTFSIYTPMSIKVTCATGGSAELDHEITVSEAGGVREAFQQAADLTVALGKPVNVRF